MNADITMPDNSINATFKLEVMPDISHLATKTELSAIESEIPDITNLATKSEVTTIQAQIPDVSCFATKTELTAVENQIPDITNLATKSEVLAVKSQIPIVPTNISSFINDSNYVTETVLSQKLLVSNALTTGNVSDNAVVFADILSKLHSSFDLSKFTVVGNPTVTNDGVAKNFSTNNGLKIERIFDFNQNWSIDVVVVTGNDIITGQKIWGTTPNNTSSGLTVGIASGYFDLYFPSANQGQAMDTQVQTVTANTQYNISLEYDGNELIYKINENIYNFNGYDADSISFLTIGLNRLQQSPFKGEIDIKSISITVDGIEVFSGNKTGVDNYTIDGNTVTIPYTLTKGGAKIADVASRPDVQSVYTANGFAPYYTIDTENQNFTLPMGDLYGMLQKLSDRISALES